MRLGRWLGGDNGIGRGGGVRNVNEGHLDHVGRGRGGHVGRGLDGDRVVGSVRSRAGH